MPLPLPLALACRGSLNGCRAAVSAAVSLVERCRVYELSSEADYRRLLHEAGQRHLTSGGSGGGSGSQGGQPQWPPAGASCYVHPLGPTSDSVLESLWQRQQGGGSGGSASNAVVQVGLMVSAALPAHVGVQWSPGAPAAGWWVGGEPPVRLACLDAHVGVLACCHAYIYIGRHLAV